MKLTQKEEALLGHLKFLLGKDVYVFKDEKKYPERVFFFQGNSCLLEIRHDIVTVWCYHNTIFMSMWDKFRFTGPLDGLELIKVAVKDYFPELEMSVTISRGIIPEIENHFTNKPLY